MNKKTIFLSVLVLTGFMGSLSYGQAGDTPSSQEATIPYPHRQIMIDLEKLVSIQQSSQQKKQYASRIAMFEGMLIKEGAKAEEVKALSNVYGRFQETRKKLRELEPDIVDGIADRELVAELSTRLMELETEKHSAEQNIYRSIQAKKAAAPEIKTSSGQ